MGSRLVTWLRTNAEDVSLGLGSVCIAIGTGIAFGYGFGLIALGVLMVAYGVWITRGVA